MQWLSGAHDLALPQSASYMERAKNCSYPDVTPLSWMGGAGSSALGLGVLILGFGDLSSFRMSKL